MNVIVKSSTTFNIDLLLSKMIETKGFPSLSNTVTEVMENLQSEQVNLQNMVDTISTDFSLTQKILKLVNSAMYSSFARNVDSISQAIQLLGFDAISHLAVSLKILDTVALKEDGSNDVLNKTLLASEISKTIVQGRLAEQASISTLIYNLGSLMVSKFAPNEYNEIKKLVNTDVNIDDACVTVLGMTYATVGLEIAKRWKFPDTLLGIIDGTGNAELLNIAKFSNVASVLITENKLEELEIHKKESEHLGFDLSKLDTLIEDRGILELDSFKLRDNSSAIERKLHVLLDKFESLKPKPRYETFIRDVCTELAAILDCQRSCVLLITPKNHLRGSYGNDISIELSTKIDINLQTVQSIFNAVVLAKKDYHVSDISKFKKSMLPSDFDVEYYNVKSFMLLPVVIRHRVVGLLYLDWLTPKTFTKEELECIRFVRNMLIPFIPRH